MRFTSVICCSDLVSPIRVPPYQRTFLTFGKLSKRCFIRFKKSLLKKLDIETITFLNRKLKVFNQQGILKIEEPKCNFDVEIGRHMLEDYLANEFENFILWSGDGDFKSSLKHLTDNGKTIHIFSVAGRVSPEISEFKPPI